MGKFFELWSFFGIVLVFKQLESQNVKDSMYFPFTYVSEMDFTATRLIDTQSLETPKPTNEKKKEFSLQTSQPRYPRENRFMNIRYWPKALFLALQIEILSVSFFKICIPTAE